MGDYLSLTKEEREVVDRTLGRLSSLIQRGIGQSHSLFSELRTELAEAIDGADTLEQVKERLAQWIPAKDFGSQIEQINIHAALGGILFVAAIEEKTIELAETGAEAFFNMAPEEAIAFFKSKKILTPEQFDALSAELRQQAFTARNLMSQRLRKVAFERLLQALKDGKPLKDFVAELRNAESRLGVEPAQDHYVENIFRTNTMQAYTEGKRQAAYSPALKAARPYILYRAIQDPRTRKSHLAIHNKAVLKDKNPTLPPFHYNCRCSFLSVSEEQIKERGIEILEDLPSIESF